MKGLCAKLSAKSQGLECVRKKESRILDQASLGLVRESAWPDGRKKQGAYRTEMTVKDAEA